jgi:hypothetical protein
MSSPSHSLTQALTPKRQNMTAALLLITGLVLCISAAAYGFIESRRTERVVIAARDVPYGHQFVADDLAIIELPLHRPVQLAGVTDPALVIGQYAARTIGPNDIVQRTMLQASPPDDPVYPNGAELGRDMVPVPFALAALGPVTDRDTVNIGFASADPELCDREIADVALGAVLGEPAPLTNGGADAPHFARAYACRFMSGVPILYIEGGESGGVAYLEMTPAQAQGLRALQAAGVTLWGERYGAHSTPLLFMDRLDASQVTLPDLTQPVSTTLRVEPQRAPVPGANSPIPGAQLVRQPEQEP